jgi:hypothetical protein
MTETEPLQSHGIVPECKAVEKETKHLRHTKPKQIKVTGFQTLKQTANLPM